MNLPTIEGMYLWLTLDPESEAHCNSIIRDLAEKYQSASFQPHITLAGVPDWSVERLDEVLTIFFLKRSQFEFLPGVARCKPFPYQKITLGVKQTNELSTLHQQVDKTFGGEYSKQEYPHLSFLYSSLPCSEVGHETERLERLKSMAMSVEKAALVQCTGTPQEWRILSFYSMKKVNGA